jgi:hypothetical protein
MTHRLRAPTWKTVVLCRVGAHAQVSSPQANWPNARWAKNKRPTQGENRIVLCDFIVCCPTSRKRHLASASMVILSYMAAPVAPKHDQASAAFPKSDQKESLDAILSLRASALPARLRVRRLHP